MIDAGALVQIAGNSSFVTNLLLPRAGLPSGNSISSAIDLAQNLRTEFLASRAGIAAAAHDRIAMMSVARSIQDAAQPLLPGPLSVFNSRQVSSASPAIAGTAADGASIGTMQVSVTQLARTHIVSSNSLTAGSPTTIAAGTDTVNVTQNGVTKSFSVSIAAGDTQAAALKKVAGAINGANLGITAAVATPATGQVRLDVTSKNTGAAAAFTLADASGNVVASTGLTTIQQQAQDAKFAVDGTAMTSPINSVLLPGGKVRLQLNAVTAGPISVSVEANAGKIAGAIGHFVDVLNQSLSKLGALATPASDGLAAAVTSQRGALSQIGIGVGPSGSASVNPSALLSAIKNKPDLVQSAISGPLGLARAVNGAANDLIGRAINPPAASASSGLASGFLAQQQGFLLNLLA